MQTMNERVQEDIADQPRLPFMVPRGGGKITGPYLPVVTGKWWSDSVTNAQDGRRNELNNAYHVARIMETEAGEQFFGEDRCTNCQKEDWECWAYSQSAARCISKPGDACARCKNRSVKGGCSKSKRAPNRRRSPGPRTPRRLLPKGGEPPPGSGGAGMTA